VTMMWSVHSCVTLDEGEHYTKLTSYVVNPPATLKCLSYMYD